MLRGRRTSFIPTILTRLRILSKEFQSATNSSEVLLRMKRVSLLAIATLARAVSRWPPLNADVKRVILHKPRCGHCLTCAAIELF
jgi:hypothetical protein